MQFTPFYLIIATALAGRCSTSVSEPAKTLSTDASSQTPYEYADIDQLKNEFSKDGTLCSSFSDNEVKDIPAECLKAVFCNLDYSTNKMGCRSVRLDKINKEEIMAKVKSIDCVQGAICKVADFGLSE